MYGSHQRELRIATLEQGFYCSQRGQPQSGDATLRTFSLVRSITRICSGAIKLTNCRLIKRF